jgi:hypothetical protein
MSISLIVEFSALAVVLVVGAAAVFAIYEMRGVYGDQRDKFLRVVTAVEDFQRLQPALLSSAERIEADGRAVQHVVMQIERIVAELNTSMSSAVLSLSERQAGALQELRDHLEIQESTLIDVAEDISNSVEKLVVVRPRETGRVRDDNGYVRIEKDVLVQDSHLRFELLKKWLDVNPLVIRRRASGEWKTAQQLIAGIPEHVEAEAEVLDGSVLLIGTHGGCEKIAIPFKDLPSGSLFAYWFDIAKNADHLPAEEIPAIITASNGSYQLVRKGRTHHVAAESSFTTMVGTVFPV